MVSEKSHRTHEMIRNHIIGTVPKNGKGSIVYSIGRVILNNSKTSGDSRTREND